MPKNLQAILDWCRMHRPDLVSTIEASRNNDAFMLLLTIGFESGRKFQHDNPAMPLDNPNSYLPE